MRKFFCLSLILICINAFGQKKFTVAYQVGFIKNFSKSNFCDSSFVAKWKEKSIKYHYFSFNDSLIYTYNQIDSNNSEKIDFQNFDFSKQTLGANARWNETFIDLREKLRVHFIMLGNELCRCEDELDSLPYSWIITDKTKIILGLKSTLAYSLNKENKVIDYVWFTKDLSCTHHPYNFKFPFGFILEMYDKPHNLLHKVVELKNNSCKIEYPINGRLISKEDYKKIWNHKTGIEVIKPEE